MGAFYQLKIKNVVIFERECLYVTLNSFRRQRCTTDRIYKRIKHHAELFGHITNKIKSKIQHAENESTCGKQH